LGSGVKTALSSITKLLKSSTTDTVKKKHFKLEWPKDKWLTMARKIKVVLPIDEEVFANCMFVVVVQTKHNGAPSR
jgi:hypothetical protein